MTTISANDFLFKLNSITLALNVSNASYNYSFESTKKAIKYKRRKKVSALNFFNITLLCFLFLFPISNRLLELPSKM